MFTNMRKMKDSGIEWIGNIPSEWEIKRIKYILSQNDGGVWGDDPVDGMTNERVLRSTEQTIDGKWDIQNPAERRISNPSSYRIKVGDLLITKSSGSAAHIGKTTLVTETEENEGYLYSNFLQRLHTNRIMFPKYLWYLLNSQISREQFVWMQNSTIGIGNINANNINEVRIPCPEYQEQQHITFFLNSKCTEIDALSADIQSEIDALEAFKRSVIMEAVTKGLDKNVLMKDSGIEWVGEIPAEWEIHPVYVYFGERKNKNYSLQEQNLLSLSYGKIIRKDIDTVGGLLPASFNTYNIVEAGDIIIRPTDLQNDKRSLRTGLVTEKGIITSAYIGLAPKGDINSAYFHYLLHSYDVQKVFYNMGNGVRQGLNYSEFSKLMVFAPSRDEQDVIVSYLNDICAEIDSVIVQKKEQLAVLAEYKKSVIYEYVTGKKEVPVA